MKSHLEILQNKLVVNQRKRSKESSNGKWIRFTKINGLLSFLGLSLFVENIARWGWWNARFAFKLLWRVELKVLFFWQDMVLCFIVVCIFQAIIVIASIYFSFGFLSYKITFANYDFLIILVTTQIPRQLKNFQSLASPMNWCNKLSPPWTRHPLQS